VLLIAGAHTAQADVNVWTSHGKEGNGFQALTVDPATPTAFATRSEGGGGFHGEPIASTVEHQRLTAGPIPRIVNGLTTHAYPAVGVVLRGDLTAPSEHLPINADTANLWCTGTLIGCRTFLTGGHCVDDLFPDEAWVYLQHAGLFTVTSFVRHRDFAAPVADVAVLKLGAQVSGIEPAAINLTDPLPFIPAAGTIVGFGRTGGDNFDPGIKHAGDVATARCLPGQSPHPDIELVCWRFLNPIGPPGNDSNICHGDSGGPLFLDLGSGPVVTGLTSGTTNFTCLPPSYTYDANVYTYRDFILGERGTDATTVCGRLPPVGDAQVEVLGFEGTLDEVTSSANHTVSVDAGRNSVRFALNATRCPGAPVYQPGSDCGDAPLFDVDMYVKAAPGASPTNFDCKTAAASVFGACIFDLPVAGTYSVFVQRVIGAGDYQVTATIFGGAPPVCGDGNLDFNEQCDDGTGAGGDCCTATCQFQPGGSRCGIAGFCDGAGRCITCVGDCNGDGSVNVEEIITMVNIALGNAEMSECEIGDANNDGQITVDEILMAVNNALNGCPLTPEQGCLASGGTVMSATCRSSTSDFPDTCAIGACGCPPDASHEVRVCNCGTGSCFDGTECVSQ
jgi:cysteine-rich repeat protein